MIRSRPGFSPVITNDARQAKSSKVTADMQPAIMKHTSAAQGPVKSPLLNNEPAPLPVERMQAQAEAALKKMQERQGPEVLVNPNPSPPPIITSPHK